MVRAVLLGLLRTMRPHQWVKNLFVVAPLFFAREVFDTSRVQLTLAAFALFCMISSSVYVLNDLADLESDRAHPVKCKRPLASGRVSIEAARVAGVGLLVLGLLGAVLISLPFAATLLGYLVLNIAYTFKLKRVAYLDVLCIASGFELRVIAGTLAAQVPPTTYLLVVTFLLAAFLGFGKRMHELAQGDGAVKQRAVLQSYQPRLLVALLYITALSTVAVYAMYTLDPATAEHFGTSRLGLSVPFTLFGVLRFLRLVSNRGDADSPTEQMLRDIPFLVNLGLWAAAVTAILYFG